MGPKQFARWSSALFAICCVSCVLEATDVWGQASGAGIVVAEVTGIAEVSPAGQAGWSRIAVGQILKAGDRVRTGDHSELVLRFSPNDTARIRELSRFQILPIAAPKQKPVVHFLQGMLYLFHRGKPTDYEFSTPIASAAIRGTEFNLAVEEGTGRTVVTMLDGVVELSTAQGRTNVNSREQGIAEVGQPPTASPMLEASTAIQWCFYYPAILDPTELGLTAQEEQALTASLTAYGQGDLLQASASYPAGRQPTSAAESIYRAALLLAAGHVEEAEGLLDALGAVPNPPPGATPPQRLADALRQMIATVRGKDWLRSQRPQSTTEWMAESYYQQAGSHLKEARDAARQAVAKSPQFGYARERLAEMEFSFGDTAKALAEADKSLTLAPRNAQAHALKGFLLAARNKIAPAILSFNTAISLDARLANAWLGRGLCRIRKGDLHGGREDLQLAVVMEPQRGVLRSYLAKAYGDEGDFTRANEEIRRAKELDARDPTAWLYSALLNGQNNRINEAVRELEFSEELKDNRQVYRSRLLLDQDRAVRSANLATIYQDAGMFDVSVREASRAVSYDYANYSPHLFLANSYDALRDPNRINLRYETPAESEYLIANLLAPVGGGLLAQSVSQQEYSKLFERDRLGLASTTEYLSRGAWVERGAQFGTFRNSSYLFEALYRTDPGQRPNNDFEEREFRLHLKQQLTPEDTIYLRAVHYEADGGDVIQHYYQTNSNLGLRTSEKQEPIISIGINHEWAPGIHTLILGSRLADKIEATNSAQTTFLVDRTSDGLDYVEPFLIHQDYESELEIYSAELQQIWQQSKNTTLFGGRFQTGDFHTKNLQSDPYGSLNTGFIAPSSDVPAAQQDFTTRFDRFTLYAYDHWHIVEPLWLEGGLSYDRLRFPQDFRAAPISDRKKEEDQFSPKAGVIWMPTGSSVLRAAYTKSIGGASVDQSLVLEPTHVAGFLQSFRSIIPESNGGEEAGARFETFGVSLEQKFPTGTYLGISGEMLRSRLTRSLGVYELNFAGFATVGITTDELKYREQTLSITINQLLGQEWSVGVRYRLSDSHLRDHYLETIESALATQDPATLKGFRPRQELDSLLHQLRLEALYNHPSGAFGQVQGLWYLQDNHGYEPRRPGDEFWQVNLFAGYRFPRRTVEIVVGILNITGQDYRLNPLSFYNELPRNRTFVARLRLNF